MIVSSIEHEDGCLAPDGSATRWDPETNETVCLSCGAIMEDHDSDEEIQMEPDGHET